MMDWQAMRGFNYQPSYGATLAGIWMDFDRSVWQREVGWARRFGSNTLRIWLDWSTFLHMGDALMDRFGEALEVLDSHGQKAMPVLFNRWVDWRYPAGGISDNDLMCSGWGFEKFDAYVEAIGRRFGDDSRIVLWDICNEPANSVISADLRHREQVWLTTMTGLLKRHTAIPVTIGAMNYDFVQQTAGLGDVLSFHPYTGPIEKLCLDHLAIARRFGKPLVCTETCCGSFDDQERGRLAQDYIRGLERHQIGWIAWQLCEGRFVSGNRGRVDSNSVRPNEGYMPFVLADGTTRPGHEWLEV